MEFVPELSSVPQDCSRRNDKKIVINNLKYFNFSEEIICYLIRNYKIKINTASIDYEKNSPKL